MKSSRLLTVFFIAMLLVSMTMATMVHVASANPATLIYVSQSVVTGIAPGASFPIDINVTDPPTDGAFGWEVKVTWDPNLLEYFFRLEGEFIKRGIYATNFIVSPATYAEANVKGELRVGCFLSNVNDPWATAAARLFRLGFKVKTAAYGSTLINLFDTVLLDHMAGGSPASTPYPNNDCFFYNTSPSHDISGRARYITLINSSVHVGEVAKINVTVLNEGTVTEPTVTLNVRANETLIGTTSLQLNGGLGLWGSFENRSRTYTVSWNTAGFALGKYNITASVPAVSGEADTSDNTFMGQQQVTIVPVGDINRDGVVDVNDLILLNSGYGTTSSGSPWDTNNDLNRDNIVNVLDLFLLGKNYGKEI